MNNAKTKSTMQSYLFTESLLQFSRNKIYLLTKFRMSYWILGTNNGCWKDLVDNKYSWINTMIL